MLLEKVGDWRKQRKQRKQRKRGTIGCIMYWDLVTRYYAISAYRQTGTGLMSIMIYEAFEVASRLFEVTRGQRTPISHPVIPDSWFTPVGECILWV